MDKISIIVPCYNEEQALPFLYEELVKVANKMPEQAFEFILINDGSKDKTIKVIKELHAKDRRIRYVSFSRNFGKEAAIFAGLKAAEGDYIAMVDADLQDPPALIEEMYQILLTGEYDSVATRRENRKGEPAIRSFFARKFYKFINRISDTKLVDGARDFRLMTRQMVNAILELKEYNRFTKGIFEWVGFETKWISYENIERVAGETKWSFWGLFFYSLDGIFAFSTRPLAIASVMGLILFFVSIIMVFFYLFKTIFLGDISAPGFPSLICTIFFVGGIQLFCLGIVGQYLSRMYLETKDRPIYVVKETENEDK